MLKANKQRNKQIYLQSSNDHINIYWPMHFMKEANYTVLRLLFVFFDLFFVCLVFWLLFSGLWCGVVWCGVVWFGVCVCVVALPIEA